jgi:Flp pilus assembly protein TadD
MATYAKIRVGAAALILSFVGASFAVLSTTAHAQAVAGAATAAAQSPGDALAGYMLTLGTHPKDFESLIGAGNAALDLGDTMAAAGFYGRAEEAWPQSPLPQAGMGAAMVAQGDAEGALVYFQRAEGLNGSVLTFAADRGLAFDLLGRHAEAQADYRLALMGTDRDEARRRLALSLAITGKKDEAIQILGPLMARGDAAAARCRALVLALSGDTEGAKRTLEATMPGSSYRMDPFFRRLPGLSSRDKAAAVNLGIFPDSSQPSYARAPNTAATTAASSSPPAATARGGDRLASIEDLLGHYNATPAPTPQVAPPRIGPPQAQPAQVASVTPRAAHPSVAKPTGTASVKERYWVQLASGTNSAALPEEFRRITRRSPDYFEGLKGYVAETGGRTRLLIGPFKDQRDATDYASALEDNNIRAFSWVSPPGQPIRSLATR